MVVKVHNDGHSEMDTENTKPKKYIIVKNHIRELPANKYNTRNSENANKEKNVSTSECSPKAHDSTTSSSNTEVKRTTKRKRLSSNSENSSKKSSYISESDLNELKSVYIKCKAVVKKIERKYGHLLHDELEKQEHSNDSDNETCGCIKNKKIIFGEDGQREVCEPYSECHVCPKKVHPRYNTRNSYRTNETGNVQIEHDYNVYSSLPDDLPSLVKILHNLDIPITYRNNVIMKMKYIKQSHSNEVKFNKKSLVDKTKKDPSEVLDFKGTNLSTIPGYQ